MSAPQRIGVAVVGLNFGEEFLPIYLRHPNVAHVAVVDPSPERLAEVGERYSIGTRYTDLADALADERVDAVHILSPVAYHAEQSLAVLAAGKHCACAVPMATSIHDLNAVLDARRDAGTNYMMMETSVYGREYLTVRDLYRRGQLGELTFYRGFHIQNLDGYPSYWLGFPPMAYVTHALSPLLALLDTTVDSVRCLGSGRLTPDRRGEYDNPFPVEGGLFRLRDCDVVADVTMSFFQTARSYTEGFALYGDRMSIEWPTHHERGPLTTFELLPPTSGVRGRRSREATLDPYDYGHLLPGPIADFTRPHDITLDADRPPVPVSAHHSGAHPHLVHEFVTSIVEQRPSRIDAATAASWTAPGVCAHESALHDGEPVAVPDFGKQ